MWGGGGAWWVFMGEGPNLGHHFPPLNSPDTTTPRSVSAQVDPDPPLLTWVSVPEDVYTFVEAVVAGTVPRVVVPEEPEGKEEL